MYCNCLLKCCSCCGQNEIYYNENNKHNDKGIFIYLNTINNNFYKYLYINIFILFVTVFIFFLTSFLNSIIFSLILVINIFILCLQILYYIILKCHKFTFNKYKKYAIIKHEK